MPTAFSRPTRRCARPSGCARRSPRGRIAARRTSKPWPTAATSWARSWPVAAPAARKRPRIPPRLEVQARARRAIRRSPRVPHAAGAVPQQPRDAPGCLGASSGCRGDVPRHARAACRRRSRAPKHFPEHAGNSPASPTIWVPCSCASERDEAGEQLRRARDILMKLAAEFPAVAQYQSGARLGRVQSRVLHPARRPPWRGRGLSTRNRRGSSNR